MNMMTNNIYNIMAIIGPSGCGKDKLLKTLLNEYPEKFHKIINHTTRPKREYETDGVDYHFISAQEFAEKVLNFDMLEATSFNDWFYGTAASSLSTEKTNIGIFNPDAILALLESNVNVVIFRLDATDKTRLLRQLNREENPDVNEIIRRFQADKLDFDGIEEEFPHLTLVNETLDDLANNVEFLSRFPSLWAN